MRFKITVEDKNKKKSESIVNADNELSIRRTLQTLGQKLVSLENLDQTPGPANSPVVIKNIADPTINPEAAITEDTGKVNVNISMEEAKQLALRELRGQKGRPPILPTNMVARPVLPEYLDFENDGKKFRVNLATKKVEKYDWQEIVGEELEHYRFKNDVLGEKHSFSDQVKLFKLAWIDVTSKEIV